VDEDIDPACIFEMPDKWLKVAFLSEVYLKTGCWRASLRHVDCVLKPPLISADRTQVRAFT
jgi:hypothetical protein